MAFLELPDPILIRIISRLDLPSFRSCELVRLSTIAIRGQRPDTIITQSCRALLSLCQSSSRLLYIKESLSLSEAPLDPDAGSAHELLESLRTRESVWRTLDLPKIPSSTYPVSLLRAREGGYVVSGDFLFSVSYKDPEENHIIISRLDLRTGDVASPWAEYKSLIDVMSVGLTADEVRKRIIIATVYTTDENKCGLILLVYSCTGGLEYTKKIKINMRFIEEMTVNGNCLYLRFMAMVGRGSMRERVFVIRNYYDDRSEVNTISP